MTEQYISQNLNHLKKQLEAEITHLEYIKRQMKNSENTINHLKSLIYNICEHNWIVDSSCYNEQTEFICSKCGNNQV
jgi:hypothetical protein